MGALTSGGVAVLGREKCRRYMSTTKSKVQADNALSSLKASRIRCDKVPDEGMANRVENEGRTAWKMRLRILVEVRNIQREKSRKISTSKAWRARA